MAALPRSIRFPAGLLGLALASTVPARAQLPAAGDGFLFREPNLTLTVRGGLGHATAGSDIFSFTTEQLTVGRGDFSGFSGGADVGIRVAPRIDVVLGAAYTGRTTASEFRDWVDDDDLPIEQTTRFERVPVTASLKAYLLPRGRSIGRFAWLPARVAPFLGAGGGAMWYRFRQEGDFVDFETREVFSDRLESTGWAPTVQALGGADLSLSPRVALTGEARYGWARANLDSAFDEFDPIDLSGFSATLGITIRL